MKINRIEQPKMIGGNLLASHKTQREKAPDSTATPSDPGGIRQDIDLDSANHPLAALLRADGEDQSDTAKKIEQSIAYMAQHLNKPLPVAALAARACLSP